MYILLSDLMMIKLWQESIHITKKTVIVSLERLYRNGKEARKEFYKYKRKK